MYMHMCTYTHTHRALIRSVTRGWILQGPSAGIAFSQSHLFCFPWVGQRAGINTAGESWRRRPPREGGGGCAERAGFGLSQGKQRGASWLPAGARAGDTSLVALPTPRLGRPADPRCHLRHVLDPFL